MTIVLRGRKQVAERISGADAPALAAAVAKAAQLAKAAANAPPPSAPKEATDATIGDSNERFKKLVSQYEVMAFIKGSPSQPRCGFSRQLVEIFKEQGVDYGYFNILSNDEVRQGGISGKATFRNYELTADVSSDDTSFPDDEFTGNCCNHRPQDMGGLVDVPDGFC